MNRRSFLRSVGVGAVAPYSVITFDSDDTTGDEVEVRYRERLVSELDDHVDETGRLFRAYEIGDGTYIKWTMENAGGDVLYQDHYPVHQTTTHWNGRTLLIEYYTEPPNRERRGNTLLSLHTDYVYHTHHREDTDIQYQEHIETGEYERIQ